MVVHDIVQPTHLLLLLGVALLVLGPKRLPSAARSVGKSMRELRGALSFRDEPARPPVIPGEPLD